MNINPPRPEGQPGPEQPPKPASIPTPESPLLPEAVHPQAAPHGEAGLAPPSGDIVPPPKTTPAIRQHLGGLIRAAEGTPDKPDQAPGRIPSAIGLVPVRFTFGFGAESTREASVVTEGVAEESAAPHTKQGGDPPKPPIAPANARGSAEEGDPIGYASVQFDPTSFGEPAPSERFGYANDLHEAQQQALEAHSGYGYPDESDGWGDVTVKNVKLQCELSDALALTTVNKGHSTVTLIPRDPSQPVRQFNYDSEWFKEAEGTVERQVSRSEGNLDPRQPGRTIPGTMHEVGREEATTYRQIIEQSEPEVVSVQHLKEKFISLKKISPLYLRHHVEMGAHQIEQYVAGHTESSAEGSPPKGVQAHTVTREETDTTSIEVEVGHTTPFRPPAHGGIPRNELAPFVYVTATHPPTLEADQQRVADYLHYYAEEDAVPPDAVIDCETRMMYTVVEGDQGQKEGIVVMQTGVRVNGESFVMGPPSTRPIETDDIADVRNLTRKPVYAAPQDKWRRRHL